MVTWKLENIYDFSKTDELLAELNEHVSKLEKCRDELNDSIKPERFIEILTEMEQVSILSYKLGAYAQLWLSENTASSERNSHNTKIEEKLTEASNKLLFFNLWFKGLDDEKAKEIINASGKYAFHLETVRKFKPFTLKEDEEKIINLKNLTGASAFSNMYDIVTNRFRFDWDGKKSSQEEVTAFYMNPDGSKRESAYKTILTRYGEESPVLGEIYKNIVNDWRNEDVKLRGYKSPIAVRNFVNNIPDEAIEALLNVVRKNVSLFQEYFEIKAKLCDIPLNRFHLYAPFAGVEKEYSFEESKKITLETYKEFSEEAFTLAKKIFDEGHVHSDIVENKRSGAFCMDVTPEVTPYILLNHTDKLRDLQTMMHEFGHGIHDLKTHVQTHFTAHPPLPMAETASIFGEMLLSTKMLKEGTDEEKINILMKQIDNQYASITRQAYFVLFEVAAHDMIAKGATIEELNEKYLELLKEQFGKMEVPELFQHEWNYIPHIHHSPFYCYAYSFGNLLVLSLFKMYEDEGESFVPKYMKILEYGGAKAPADILSEVGIDIKSEEFWQQGFEVIKEEMEMLKKLTL